MKMIKIESIFKVIQYRHRCNNKSKLRYPSFKVHECDEIYFKTLDEVEEYMQKKADYYQESQMRFPFDDNFIDLYAYVVIEIPLREEINTDVLNQYLSFRTYLPDCTLWAENDYGNFIPKCAKGDDYNYWGFRNMFWGREPAEIKFKPGDIVEVLGCPGNFYWSNDTVDLAIVVKAPPTKAKIEEMRKHYFDTHSGFDLCDHALSNVFGHSLDTYEVIPYAQGCIDHAPTICVFEPTKAVSTKRRNRLMKSYKQYKEGLLNDDEKQKD